MSEISPDPAAATPPDVAARDPQDARDTQDTQDSHSTPGGSTPQRSKVVPATVALTAAAAAIALAVIPGSSTPSSTPGGSPTSTSTTSTGQATPGSLPSPKAELLALARRDPKDPLAIGRADAPVVMVQLSDFACGYCRQYALETEPALIEKYVKTGVLRIEWHDFPYLSDGSRRAAIAGRAAAAQGKFWELHQAIFADTTSGEEHLELFNLSALAQGVGIEPQQFAADMADKAAYDAVKKDFEAAQALGVSGTPSFVINGRPFVGAQPLANFAGLIELAAAEAG